MPQFALNLNTSYGFIFFILIAIFIAFAYFIYRYTNPPVSKKLRIFLFSLRALALAILIFMLTEPIASFTSYKKEKPVVALLLDKSASMGLKDSETNPTRFSVVKNIIQGDIALQNDLEKLGDVRLVPFSKNIEATQTNISTLQPDGGSTNIGDIMYAVGDELSEKNFNAAILFTDGSNNSGRDPVRAAQNLGVPVYVVGIGDPSEPKDVAIAKFLTNEIAYVNNKIPVEITIQTNGFDGKESTISLREDNQTLDSQNIRLTQNFQEHKIVLHFTPKTEGLHKYTLLIPDQPGEKITQNNSRIFFVNVLKSKIKILYINGAPSWDYAFIRQTLNLDPNVDLTAMSMVKKGEFYQQTTDNENRRPALLPSTTRQWNEYDLVILGDINLSDLGSNNSKMIADFIATHGKAILFLGGASALNPNEYRNSPLRDLLPVRLKGKYINQPFQITLTSSGKNSSLMMLDEDTGLNERLWHDFPPILGANLLGSAKPNATVLAANPVENSPLIVSGRIGKGKTMVLGFSSMWRWSFLMEGIGKSNRYFDKFMGNIVRWLVTRDIDKQVKINTDKIVYRSGEEIFFSSQVYNSNYDPISDAAVQLLVKQKENPDFTPINISLLANPTGEGTYSGKYNALPPGDYEFSGEATQGDRVIGKDSGTFSVGHYSLEYENTELNEEMLKRIATLTNGNYYTPEDVQNILDDIKLEEKTITKVKEFSLWDNIWFFIIFVGLLGVEWTIRKRRGLA